MDSAFRADLILERKVIIELKSVIDVEEVHFKQLLTYLKLTGLKLGLLINFNVPYIKNGLHRVVNKFEFFAPLRLLRAFARNAINGN